MVQDNNPDTHRHLHHRHHQNNKPPLFSSLPYCDFLLRLTKAALTLSFLLSISLITFTSLSTSSTTSTPHFLSLSRSNLSQTQTQTRPQHILFSLSASAATWPDRRLYSLLWHSPNLTRTLVWFDRKPLQPGLDYRVSTRTRSKNPSDRIARIVKESYELGLPDVRWFVMGDDDTVFFPENVAAVLAKYDHRRLYYVGGNSESVEQDVMHGYGTAFGGGGFAISYALAAELVGRLDGCIHRYRQYYGSDEKVSACVAELGVPLTTEPGFHQVINPQNPKMNNSQSASYNAGQAKGQAQEKTNQAADKAGDMLQSAKESMQEAGSQIKAKAQDATEAVKNATGINK